MNDKPGCIRESVKFPLKKSKIAFRLFLYFSAALLLFSLVIGGVFLMLFRSHTIEIHKADLEKRALTIASVLSDAYSNSGSPGIAAGSGAGTGNGISMGMGMGMGMGITGGKQGNSYGAYLRLLDEIAMADAWVVDENLNLVTAGRMGREDYRYTDLPHDAETVVREAFQGKTTFSESFSKLLSAPALTVGTPIVSGNKPVGVLLLHTPIEGMEESITQGFRILAVSVAVALFLSIFLSVYLSVSFTGPLNKMKKAALSLAAGDYTVRTDIRQKDEIGELASAIDILSDKLDTASRESEKLDKLRRSFTANISHELRTPVTVIRGSLEALCDGVVTDPAQVAIYHQQMKNESIFLQRLVNDLLDLSRLQNTDFQIERQDLCLDDVLNDVIRSAKQMAKEKQVEIRLVKDSEDRNLSGDYDRLRQMFLIVLDNAVKFSPERGMVTVVLNNRTVSVTDQGPGIPGEDLPYIFDRFYKARSPENKTGTGLGLSIARQIAERHNINITVSSMENEGTAFRFEL